MNEEIRAFAEHMRQQGASAQEIDTYIRGAIERLGPPEDRPKPSLIEASAPLIQADAAKDAASVVQNPDPNRDTTGDLQKLRDMGLGLAASAPQAIPGAELAQAGIRSAVRGQPYREALSDMRRETDPIPVPLKIAAQLPAILATGKLPLSPAKAGALFGGASQALNADPDIPLGDRAFRTALGGVGGATAGKALDIAGTMGRAWWPGKPTSGAIVKNLESEMGTADRANYGAASKEATGSPAQIAGVRKIFDRPVVKEIADNVRGSEAFANADDATVLSEVYRELSKAQRGLQKTLATDFDPTKARNLTDILKAKRDLLTETDKYMPSFRSAVARHREYEQEIGAVGTGVNAAKRAFGATPSGDKLRQQSIESYAERMRKMTPENRAQAVRGTLAETKKQTGFQPNAVSLGGLLTSIRRPMQASNLLRMAGDEGQSLADIINRLVLSGGFMAGR